MKLVVSKIEGNSLTIEDRTRKDEHGFWSQTIDIDGGDNYFEVGDVVGFKVVLVERPEKKPDAVPNEG